MTILGLNNNNYLVNNPIWVTFGDLENYYTYVQFTATLYGTSTSFSFKLYNRGQTSVTFDMAEVAKGLMPIGKAIIGNTLDPYNNLKLITITATPYTVNEGTPFQAAPTVTRTKSYIRGGSFLGTNKSLPGVTLLIDGAQIPVWEGYPVAFSYIGMNELMTEDIVVDTAGTNVDLRRVIGCNSLYLGFRNSKGVYQYWLFETWELDSKSGSQEYIETRDSFNSLGGENDHTITVRGKIPREYYRLMRSLSQSPEVYAYKLAEKVTGETSNWTRLHNDGNSFNDQSHEDIQEVSFSFDLLTKESPLEIW